MVPNPQSNSISHVNGKAMGLGLYRICPMSLYFYTSCHMSLSFRSMSLVEFKKSPCRPVDFRGQGPYCVEFKKHPMLLCPLFSWHYRYMYHVTSIIRKAKIIIIGPMLKIRVEFKGQGPLHTPIFGRANEQEGILGK